MSYSSCRENSRSIPPRGVFNKQELADYTPELLADELGDLDNELEKPTTTKIKTNCSSYGTMAEFDPKMPQSIGFNSALLGPH